MNEKIVLEDNRTVMDDKNEVYNMETDLSVNEQEANLTLQKKREILRKRAVELARESQEEQDKSESYMEVVEFLLANERYAVESKYVRIQPLKEITPIPCTPSFVLGIINVRGEVLSVIDIKKFFNLPDDNDINGNNKILITETDKMKLGILADRVIGMNSIPLNEIQSSLSTSTDIRDEYLIGVTDERLVILDVTKILSDESIIVDEEVGTVS